MANCRFIQLGLVAVVLGLAVLVEGLGDCRSSSDCGDTGCCVIGMMRFSTPYCQPLKQIGDDCRPASSTPVNMTLSYPHGLKINLINAHQIMCPCAEGLFCNTMADAVCTLGNGMTDNDIY